MNSIQAPTILFSVYREDAVTNAGVGEFGGIGWPSPSGADENEIKIDK